MINSMQSLNISKNGFNAKLNIRKLFQIDQHYLSRMVEHHEMHVKYSEHLKLTLGKEILVVLEVVGLDCWGFLLGSAHVVGDFYQN